VLRANIPLFTLKKSNNPEMIQKLPLWRTEHPEMFKIYFNVYKSYQNCWFLHIKIAICTKNNKDTSWELNNEAWELARKVSKLLWETYR
jgi:hypothetical protein